MLRKLGQLTVLVCVISFCLVSLAYSAGIPVKIDYNGYVKSGGSQFSGAGLFKFAIVNSDGTTTYWSNDGTSTAGSEPTAGVSSTVTNGIFNVVLGETTITNMNALPASVFQDNDETYLRIWFNDGTSGYEQLTPDKQIVSVPYAYQAYSVGVLTGPTSGTGEVLGTDTTQTVTNKTIDNTNDVIATAITSGNLDVARLPDGGPWTLSSDLNIDNDTFVVSEDDDSVGVGTPIPGALFEVEVAADYAGTGVLFDFKDADQLGLRIDASQTTENILTLLCDSLTSGTAISITNADSLTTGQILNLTSNSATNNDRKLVQIENSNAAAISATPLRVVQSSSDNAVEIVKSYTHTANFTDIYALSLNNTDDCSGSINVDSLAFLIQNSCSGASGGTITSKGIASWVTGDTGGTHTVTAGEFIATTGDVVRGGYFSAKSGTDNYAIVVPSDGGDVGLGTLTPDGDLELSDEGSNTLSYITNYGDSNTSYLTLRSADGTEATPAAIDSGEALGILDFQGWSNQFDIGARIHAEADNNWGASERGTDLIFSTRDGNDALTEHMVLSAEGYLGVGVLGPVNKLDIKGNIASGWAAAFFNDGDNVNNYGLAVQCGTDNNSGTNVMIDWFDGDGDNIGQITSSGGTISYGTFTANHNASIPAEKNHCGYPYGTIMVLKNVTTPLMNSHQANYYVEPSNKVYSNNIFGIYSSKYKDKNNLHSIYSLGDGHVLVTSENGNIKVGDRITSSSLPGLGMKATAPGTIVGIALEEWNAADVEATEILADGTEVKTGRIAISYYPGIHYAGEDNSSVVSAESLVLSSKTVPDSIPPDSVQLYSEDISGYSKLKVRDESGNITTLSPHDPETGEWVFYSQNVKTGRIVQVNMEKLVKAVEKITGENFMVETFDSELK